MNKPEPQCLNNSKFLGWSKNIGKPSTGMPALVASITPELPPCVIKSFTFGCPKILTRDGKMKHWENENKKKIFSKC